MIRTVMRFCAVAAVVGGFLGLTSCGGAIASRRGHLERRPASRPWAPWSGRVGPTVAKLSVTGGEPVVFLVVECHRDEPQCHEIGYYMEPTSKYGERSLNEGPRVNHPEPAERYGASDVFDLRGVSYECDGVTLVAIVDGLLRQSRDTVTDSSRGTTVTFRKAPIPARFRPEGVLVYGQLLAHANTITVRNSRGAVVAREHLLGAGEEAHFKLPATRRSSCKAN